MTALTDLRNALSRAWPFQVLPSLDWSAQRPTYAEASPRLIDAALSRSQRRASGNWYVFGASRDVTTKPVSVDVAGLELVAWRDADGHLRVGPAECPHLGANLATGTVECGTLICPWHGLRITGTGSRGWSPRPAFDDGVLTWVRLDEVGGEVPTDEPVVVHRPAGATIAAVARLTGVCEPRDVIANRLDPWHGAWFHPYSFTRLDVLEKPPVVTTSLDDRDVMVVAVTFRLGRLGIPVLAEFSSPEPRTILMRITSGEGTGSVVETHATPLAPGPDGTPRTEVIEAVIAHSERSGFAHAGRVAPLLLPFMRHAAARLWRDDLQYAERLYALRRRAQGAGTVTPPAAATRPARAAGSASPPTG